MKLSKQQAIKEHRKMWNWIADEIEKTGHEVTKYDYLRQSEYAYERIRADCFLCDYIRNTGDGLCGHCPLVWYKDDDRFVGRTMCIDPKSPYFKYLLHDTKGKTYEEWVKESSKYAREIANLPIRPNAFKKFLKDLFSRGE